MKKREETERRSLGLYKLVAADSIFSLYLHVLAPWSRQVLMKELQTRDGLR